MQRASGILNDSSPTANLASATLRARIFLPKVRATDSTLQHQQELTIMLAITTHRPRNVDAPRAAAILYGDWGTSKAYVIGLAFAVAGYSSFWLIAAMCVLTALVGLNYMVICRLYPDGGGVYASVRHRSEVISIVGAFLLIADYL